MDKLKTHKLLKNHIELLKKMVQEKMELQNKINKLDHLLHVK